MAGIKCPDCNGKGYKETTFVVDERAENIKVWCETGKGTGQMKYEGRRTGIAWERE